jgi:hypothetical protein
VNQIFFKAVATWRNGMGTVAQFLVRHSQSLAGIGCILGTVPSSQVAAVDEYNGDEPTLRSSAVKHKWVVNPTTGGISPLDSVK